jgi:triacylglycerol lipase
MIKDVKYGPHERHVMDVYEPVEKPSDMMPVIVHLHGGGFQHGDKEDGENMGKYFSGHGILFISMNYRYAPEIQWPEGTEDIAGVLKWVKENVKKYGGDPDRIFLSGHSAGAGHVASYVFFEGHQIPDDGVVGAILISIPNADTTRLHGPDFSYMGKDESKYPAMSSVDNVDSCKVPIYMVIAENDHPNVHFSCHSLINALYERDNKLPLMKVAEGHDHLSTFRSCGTEDDCLGPEILKFAKSI